MKKELRQDVIDILINNTERELYTEVIRLPEKQKIATDVDFSKPSLETSDVEVYYVDKLGINVVLFTVETDGPMNWGIESGTEDCCTAFFVYKGVEYVYMGGVSHGTMKAFLNTLE